MADMSGWFALAGALGGVTLTGIIGFVTAGLNHKWGEQTRITTYHQQQLRAITDQCRQVCHDYLVAANSYWLAVEQLYHKACRGDEFDHLEDMKPAITALQDTYVYPTISCGTRVRNLADSYNGALYAVHHAAKETDREKWAELYPKTREMRGELRKAMRAELGVND
jgi:hypothetical protein